MQSSFATTEQVEYWILQSTNPSSNNPQLQWQASQQLQEWIHLATTTATTSTSVINTNEQQQQNHHRSCVARICFELLVDPSKAIAVRFSALTTLGRIPLNLMERQQVRTYLLHQFMRCSVSNGNSNGTRSSNDVIIPPFFRNKAAMILVQYILQDVGSNSDNNEHQQQQQQDAWPTIRQDLVQLAESFPVLFLKTIETLLEDFVMAHEEPSISGHSTSHEQQQQQRHGGSSHSFDRESMRRVKDVLKGYHIPNGTMTAMEATSNASQNPSQQTTTLLECLFECTVSILGKAVAVTAACSASGANAATTSTSSNAANTTIHILALDTVKAFFQWTGDLSFLGNSPGHARNSTTRVVDACLELMLQSIQPAPRFPDSSSIQLSAWKAWEEWMTIASSSSSFDTTPIITSSTSALDIEDNEMTTEQSSLVAAQQDQENKRKKMTVMIALLERIHEYEILPFHGGESTVAEIEVVIEVAKLITTFGFDMMIVWEQQEEQEQLHPTFNDMHQQKQSASTESRQQIDTLFHQVLDLFFRAFSYDDIDVSGAVLPLATRFATSILLVTIAPTSTKRGTASQVPQPARPPYLLMLLQQQMPKFLNILYKQLKYPPDFGYDFENEDDAEEEMYRAQLIKVYNKLVMAAPEICLQFVCEATRQQISDNQNDHSNGNADSTPTTTMQDVEATLRLLYHYCEGVRPPPGMKTAMRNPTFVSLLYALHNSSNVIFAQFAHREVLCLYFETAVRYYPIYLQQEPQLHLPPTNGGDASVNTMNLLAKILESLSGPWGLQHPHPRVRSRCSYLILRLVTVAVSRLRPLVDTAVAGIQTLLTSNMAQDLLRPEDTLYLFETIGLLLGKTGLEGQEQQQYLAQVMTPHVRSIDQVLATPGLLNDAEHYGEILSNSVAAIAFLSKGFTKQPPEQVQVVLVEAVNITLRVLEALPMSEPVRNKTMVFLQRMIQCIGEKLLIKVPDYLRLLIEYCTSEDALFVAQVFNQLCIKFKEKAVPAIDTSLLPFLRKCQTLVPVIEDAAQSTSGGVVAPHIETEILAIQKLSFIVVHHVVMYNATSALLSPTNAASFESVLQTVSEGAVRVQEPAVKKTCIRFFREITYQWTIPNAATTGVNESFRRGLVAFVCQNVVPGILQSMMKESFDERDAQQYRNVSELAHIMLLIKERTNDIDMLLSALHATGQVPVAVLDGLRVSSDVKSVEATLRPMFQLKRSVRAP